MKVDLGDVEKALNALGRTLAESKQDDFAIYDTEGDNSTWVCVGRRWC